MPDSLLSTLMDRATSPLVPQRVTQPIVDRLTEPHLDQSVNMARLKGFLGGALEGARQQTSPAMLAGSLVDDIPIALGLSRFFKPVAKMAPELAQAVSAGARDVLNPRTAATMQTMYKEANPVYKGMEAAGKFGTDAERTVGNLWKNYVPKRSPAPNYPSLGEMSPSFTAVGEEGAYNAGRGPVAGVYNRIMSTMGAK